MKKLILALIFISTTPVLGKPWCENLKISDVTDLKIADTDELPYHLRGAYICVLQKDGCTKCMPAEDFKIVKRDRFYESRPAKKHTELKEKEAEKKLNRLSVLGGYGPVNSVTAKPSNSGHKFESASGFVGGVSYQRKISPMFSVGGQAQTNGTFLLDLGVDF